MNEKAIFYALIGTNVLLYILAFALAFVKKKNMTLFVILLVIESVTVLFFASEYIELSKNARLGPERIVEFLYWFGVFFISITFTLLLVVAILAKMPSWHTVASILLSISLLWATFFIIDAIMEKQSAKQSAALQISRQALYEELLEKGELLTKDMGSRNIYYYNDKLYETRFYDEEIQSIFINEPDNSREDYYKNNYIRVYGVNEKYILMLEKNELDKFGDWIIYVENVGYMPLYSDGRFKAMNIIENNKYTVLNEEIHAKIQEKWGDRTTIKYSQ